MLNKGFTLIETLVYLGLFGIIVGGISVAAYAVMEAGGRNQAKLASQAEGDFLLGKFDWALAGASSIIIPAPGIPAPSVAISKYDFPSNPLIFDLNGGKLRLKEGTGGVRADLNNDAARVASLNFIDIPASGGGPEGMTAKFTLISTTTRGTTISQDFQTTKYLRK